MAVERERAAVGTLLALQGFFKLTLGQGAACKSGEAVGHPHLP
ncbi:hypothetical protein [Geobacillus sp. YHL]|nr:hypothetical protein [Geobacillus sp. YHL]